MLTNDESKPRVESLKQEALKRANSLLSTVYANNKQYANVGNNGLTQIKYYGETNRLETLLTNYGKILFNLKLPVPQIVSMTSMVDYQINNGGAVTVKWKLPITKKMTDELKQWLYNINDNNYNNDNKIKTNMLRN